MNSCAEPEAMNDKANRMVEAVAKIVLKPVSANVAENSV